MVEYKGIKIWSIFVKKVLLFLCLFMIDKKSKGVNRTWIINICNSLSCDVLQEILRALKCVKLVRFFNLENMANANDLLDVI